MTSVAILFGILGALLLGAMSPGPSFLLVTRLSMTGSRRRGVAAALGMGAGGALFALLALVGLIALLQEVEWLFLTFKVCGGLYLLYLGIHLWRSASDTVKVTDADGFTPLSTTTRADPWAAGSFWLGLTTQVANPKTAVVYASIFSALLPEDPERVLLFVLPLAVFFVEAAWYALVAIVFSAPPPQRAYLRSKGWIDRAAGVVLGGLGVRLVAEDIR